MISRIVDAVNMLPGTVAQLAGAFSLRWVSLWCFWVG